MSDSEVKVLEERIKGLDGRIEALEKSVPGIRKDMVDILVELKVLGTRVTLYAAVIASVVSMGLTIALKLWK